MRYGALALALIVALAPGARSAGAHEVRPGYLEIRQAGAESYDLLWKVPARGDLRLAIDPRFPERCQPTRPRSSVALGGAYADRWQIVCGGGLATGTVAIEGLSATLTDVLVRIERRDGAVQSALLTPETPSFVVEAKSRSAGIAATYARLGFEHILRGVDHLLFVLALLLLIEGRRRLIGAVTAFTVAHSLTLAAATLGWVHVPQQPVEAVIALSIVFVAAEIVHAKRGRPGLTQQKPWLVALTFGLLHGFGFAGALTEVGIPEQAVPLALLFFNLGVEAGQLLFIAFVSLLMLAARDVPVSRSAWAWRIPAYGIGGVASYWAIERIVGFWG